MGWPGWVGCGFVDGGWFGVGWLGGGVGVCNGWGFSAGAAWLVPSIALLRPLQPNIAIPAAASVETNKLLRKDMFPPH